MSDRGPDDPLELLRGHLRDAQLAAARLMQEASGTPDGGWESVDYEQAAEAAAQATTLGDLLRSLRELIPEELREQLSELISQLIEVLRALLELLRSRLTAPSRQPAASAVQDIPIS